MVIPCGEREVYCCVLLPKDVVLFRWLMTALELLLPGVLWRATAPTFMLSGIMPRHSQYGRKAVSTFLLCRMGCSYLLSVTVWVGLSLSIKREVIFLELLRRLLGRAGFMPRD